MHDNQIQPRTYNHRITRLDHNSYRLSWCFDANIQDTRVSWPQMVNQDTDETGAIAFAKKWRITMPLTATPTLFDARYQAKTEKQGHFAAFLLFLRKALSWHQVGTK